MIRTPIDVAGIYSYRDNLQISHAVKAGNTIYISGKVALDPEGNVVGEGNAEVQAEYIWSNIEKVLGEAGSSLDEIFKIFIKHFSFVTHNCFTINSTRSWANFINYLCMASNYFCIRNKFNIIYFFFTLFVFFNILFNFFCT